MDVKRFIASAAYGPPTKGFSHAVVLPIGEGRRAIFVSGITARGPEGAIVGSDLGAQTRQVFDNLRRVLAEAEASLDDVVQLTTYLTDIDQYAEYGKVRQEIWPDAAPASTTVQVVRLFDPRLLVEVSAIAIR